MGERKAPKWIAIGPEGETKTDSIVPVRSSRPLSGIAHGDSVKATSDVRSGPRDNA